MVSIFQRLYWLIMTVPLVLGLPLLANAGMINTQLLDTDVTFTNSIFDNAFTDSVTAGFGCEYAMDSNLLAVLKSRLDCVLPRTEEESNNILHCIRAGGNELSDFLRHDIGRVLLANRAGNLTDGMISDGLMELFEKESCDHCYSHNLGSIDFMLELGLPLIFPQAATINPKNFPLNLSFNFNKNQPVSFPNPSTDRFKPGLQAVATICQQRWAWPTHQSGSDSPARYQWLAVARTSTANVRFNHALGDQEANTQHKLSTGSRFFPQHILFLEGFVS